jgi:hypothetical protein
LALKYGNRSDSKEFGSLKNFKIETESGQNIVEIKFDLKPGNESFLLLDIEYLNQFFSTEFSPEYFEVKEEADARWNDPDLLKAQMENFSSPSPDEISAWIEDGTNGVIFRSFFSKRESRYHFDYENDKNYQYIRGFGELSEVDKNEFLSRIEDVKTNGFPITKGIDDLNLISLLEESFKMLGFNLEFPDPKTGETKFEVSSILRYIFQDFLMRDLIGSLKGFLESFERISSLSSVRANSERLYSNNSDVVDINALLIDFSRITLKKSDHVQEFINRSLKLFQIGDKIKINRHQGVASEIFVIRDGEEVLLADLGFGYTQLLPIILKIAVAVKRKENNDPFGPYSGSVFLLEEPESNLHPSYQSKLAELIFDAANTFNIQFIIETHSEYMIRNFQYLTATKQIPSNGTKIYYFNQPDSEDFKEAPYREIKIMSDGRLSNEFGEGFFDEIPRLLAFLYNSSFN